MLSRVYKSIQYNRAVARFLYLEGGLSRNVRGQQGRSQVFIGGGARWGNVKFIHKTLLQNINPEKFLL